MRIKNRAEYEEKVSKKKYFESIYNEAERKNDITGMKFLESSIKDITDELKEYEDDLKKSGLSKVLFNVEVTIDPKKFMLFQINKMLGLCGILTKSHPIKVSTDHGIEYVSSTSLFMGREKQFTTLNGVSFKGGEDVEILYIYLNFPVTVEDLRTWEESVEFTINPDRGLDTEIEFFREFLLKKVEECVKQ